MVSFVKLNQLKRRKELMQQRNRAQEELLRKKLNSNRAKERDVDKEIENEEYAVLVKQLKSTCFPVSKTTLLVGMALKAKQLLDGPDDMQKARAIDEYTKLYQAFVEEEKRKKDEKAQDDSLEDDEASLMPEGPDSSYDQEVNEYERNQA